MQSVASLVNPTSIALIGASANLKKVGGIVIRNLILGYKGQIFPINPKETSILNLPCYSDFFSLPLVPDLTIIAIPAEKALEVLPAVGDKGAKNLLIFSAGFKEAGDRGKDLEQKLLDLSQKYEFNLLGPNCLGFINNQINLNATFGNAPTQRGNLNILSQSGAIATSFFDWSTSHSLGVDTFITLGNKSVLNENHFLDYYSETKNNFQEPGLSSLNPIGMYLESISDGQKLVETAKKITKKQAVFLLKPGKTKEAASAMQSHTGSLAGSNEVLEAALKESGIIRADTLEEFFNLSKALSWENVPTGNKVAVISNAGGPGVISADAIATSNLELATIPESVQNLLSQKLPRMASLHNPIDVLGDSLADRFQSVLEALLVEESVDSILVILTPQLMTEIEKTAQVIGENSVKHSKPIYCSFMGGTEVAKGERILNQAKIPNFAFPESAIKTLSQVWSWQEYRNKKSEEDIASEIIFPSELGALLTKTTETVKLLDPNSTTQILNYLKLPTAESIVTNNLEVAEDFASKVGWPVVLKTTEENLTHKSDKGGVVGNISSFVELSQRWKSLSPSGTEHIQVQKQLENGYELLIGFKRDQNFGNYFVFGLGGKLVNLHKDASLALFPLTPRKIEEAINDSKYAKLVYGYRDYPRIILEKFTKDLQVLSQFFAKYTQIAEMEINPVIVNHSGHYLVDTKITLV